MTEAEWLTESDFARQIQFVEGRLSPRKSRLLAAALCRAAGQVGNPDLARALDEVEWYADGLAGSPELQRAWQQCRELAVRQYEVSYRLAERGGEDAGLEARAEHELAWAVAYAAAGSVTLGDVVMQLSGHAGRSRGGEFAAACLRCVRDVAGNPFRPVTFDPAWRTDTAVALANQIYLSRDFSVMPILADALQDAGCTDDEVLNHLRDPHLTHVRGCWAVDGVLGRS